MKFYCLHEGYYESIKQRLELLKNACNNLNIEFISLDSLSIDYSNLPKLNNNDLLYNCSRGAEYLETLLLNNEVTTFYIKPPLFVENPRDSVNWSLIHEKEGLSAPKTIFNITTDRQLLKTYIDYLGGFPIIIKATGKTRGIGTIKIENWHNLFSTIDYLSTTSDSFIMREFIENVGTARIIVLGDKVIASEFRDNLNNDFRVSGGCNIATGFILLLAMQK